MTLNRCLHFCKARALPYIRFCFSLLSLECGMDFKPQYMFVAETSQGLSLANCWLPVALKAQVSVQQEADGGMLALWALSGAVPEDRVLPLLFTGGDGGP